jgi:hypothetical protein
MKKIINLIYKGNIMTSRKLRELRDHCTNVGKVSDANLAKAHALYKIVGNRFSPLEDTNFSDEIDALNEIEKGYKNGCMGSW